MKTLFKNGTVVNVFTGTLEKVNVLVEDSVVAGVDNYVDSEADRVVDVTGKYICPGFIDGHMHIESTMLSALELAKVSLLHGTTTIVADPHEIANVCGIDGISYMLESSRELPLRVFINIPSCVPATPFDESGAILNAEDIAPLYDDENVLGLAEMMNYPGVIARDPQVMKKIEGALRRRKLIDGHAPLLSGKSLDRYISAGIKTDHECSNETEAVEKLKKGQWIMIREGTAARNLEPLLRLFDDEFYHRCLLVTDDRHPADLIRNGHIDNVVRLAVQYGKPVIRAIQMATLNAAICHGLKRLGAVAPGYKADLVFLDDLESIDITDVYSSGKQVVKDKTVLPIEDPVIPERLTDIVMNSFKLDRLSEKDFLIDPRSDKCRVVKIVPGQLLTDEWITNIDWSKNNGIDIDRDILKLAVIERHNHTGHKGLGFINGIGMKKGAIASSVSHDSHNLIVIGTNDRDMAKASNRIKEMGGGNVVAVDGEIVAEMPLPIAGLMSNESAEQVALENEAVRKTVYDLGVPKNVEPFMNMAFVSLPVIPHIKMTPGGLVDVDKFARVSLYV